MSSAEKSTAGQDRKEVLRGEAVYLFAFDIGYEMTRRPVQTLLGQPIAEFVVDDSRRGPRQLFFYRPQMVRLPDLERFGPSGPVRIQRTVKFLPVGAISIAVHVPFEVDALEDLVVYHDLRFSNGSLADEVRKMASEITRELLPYLVRPHETLPMEEVYTVFCLDAGAAALGDGAPAEAWLSRRRREIAALLTAEREIGALSEQEADESTARHLSYYGNDLVVVDWDAALMLDEPRRFAETLHLMELANLQLAELEAYDRLLDDSLDRAYRDLRSRGLRSRTSVLRELRELRIDLARLSDELSNTTKFFGDWHLARIYQAVAARFHLADWSKSIDEKLKTLDDLYGMLAQDRTTRIMLILEIAVVVLFVADILMLFLHIR